MRVGPSAGSPRKMMKTSYLQFENTMYLKLFENVKLTRIKIFNIIFLSNKELSSIVKCRRMCLVER